MADGTATNVIERAMETLRHTLVDEWIEVTEYLDELSAPGGTLKERFQSIVQKLAEEADKSRSVHADFERRHREAMGNLRLRNAELIACQERNTAAIRELVRAGRESAVLIAAAATGCPPGESVDLVFQILDEWKQRSVS